MKFFLSILLIVSISIMMTSCSKELHTKYKKLPPKQPTVKTSPEQDKKDKTQEVDEQVPNVSSKRIASMKLVEEGNSYFEKENLLQAEKSFRNAIEIDWTNGQAYYYLAMTHFKKGEFETADGLLDKAESLLNKDKVWIEKISVLKGEINTKSVDNI